MTDAENSKQENLVDLDCEALPLDLLDPQQLEGEQAFKTGASSMSGDIIRQGADGRGGRTTVLCPQNAVNNLPRVRRRLWLFSQYTDDLN